MPRYSTFLIAFLTTLATPDIIRAQSLEQRVSDLETALAEAQARILALENSSVNELDGLVRFETVDGQPTVVFTGVNVQIQNGLNATNTVNGVGNLIVGYNEPRDRPVNALVCSDGQYTTQFDCEAAGEIWALSHKSGSHNIVAGSHNSYSRYGGLVMGHQNVINQVYGTVSGGQFNTASGAHSAVSGGGGNAATQSRTTVCGGNSNAASGLDSTVVGGIGNRTTASQAVILGGESNVASGIRATVSGGIRNTASGVQASVSGGRFNTAGGAQASITAGSFNTADGPQAAIGGGSNNRATGQESSVSGGRNRSATGIHDWAAGSLFEDF